MKSEEKVLDFKTRARLENVHHSVAAGFMLALASSLSFYFGFGLTQYTSYIRALMALAFTVAVTRLYFCFKIIKNHSVLDKYFMLLPLATITNGLLWGLHFAVIFWETRFTGNLALGAMMIMMSFATSALTINTTVPRTFVYFMISLTTPSLLVAVKIWQDNPIIDSLVMVLLLSIFSAYQLVQFRNMKKLTFSRIMNGINLEKAIDDLKVNQTNLLHETAKSQHSSRLASLGEMAGGIAHEVNNPLAIINGHLTGIKRDLSSGSEIDREKNIQRTDKAMKAIERISSIVKGLKNFSQQRDSDPLLPASMKTIISETLDFCAERVRSNGIELRIDSEFDYEVSCRSIQISQVLINLINNANDAIKDYPENEKWIQVKLTQRGNSVYIFVSNGGPSIPQHVREKLFQPFFTTKAVGSGTGLGLSISKGIMNQHNGDLWLETDTPYTTFVISLPHLKSRENAA